MNSLEASLGTVRDPLFANARDHSVCPDGNLGHVPTETAGGSHIKWLERWQGTLNGVKSDHC